jgi:hypothetical protein
MSDKELKLFVIGEQSPDPDDWAFGSLPSALVIAHDAEEAKRLAPSACGEPVEIAFDKPKKLLFENTGGWDE